MIMSDCVGFYKLLNWTGLSQSDLIRLCSTSTVSGQSGFNNWRVWSGYFSDNILVIF